MAREKVGESPSNLLGPEELNELRRRILRFVGTASARKWVTRYMLLVDAIDSLLWLWSHIEDIEE